MTRKLWFIRCDDLPVRVFVSRAEARMEIADLEGGETEEEYELYSIDFDDLEDYPEELELAEENGFF